MIKLINNIRIGLYQSNEESNTEKIYTQALDTIERMPGWIIQIYNTFSERREGNFVFCTIDDSRSRSEVSVVGS